MTSNDSGDFNTLALKFLALEQRLLGVETNLRRAKGKPRPRSYTFQMSQQQLDWVLSETVNRNISRAELMREALTLYMKSLEPKGFQKRLDAASATDNALEF